MVTPLKTTLNEQQDGRWVLKLIGGVDSTNHHLMWSVDSLDTLLKQLVAAQAQKLVFDLTDLERLDSEGLRTIINTHKDFSTEGIEIVLQNPNLHLHRLIKIMHFDQLVAVQFDK